VEGDVTVGWWTEFTTWIAVVYDSGWGVLIRVILIIVISLLARWIFKLIIRRAVDRLVRGVKKMYEVSDTKQLTTASPISAVRRVQRTRTLGRVFSNAITAAISVIAVLLIIWTLFPGASTAFALITAAVGAGLGLGAQNIVRDILAGVFLAAEDQIGIGDVVTVVTSAKPVSGVVEDVGIRVTSLRDVEGTLWFIPNGQTISVGNQSQGWARAIVDLAIPYYIDVDAVQDTIKETIQAFGQDPAWRSRLFGPPESWGIQSISTEALVLRVVAKTRTSAKDDVARELRARIKRTLDASGVVLPPVTSIRIDAPEADSKAKSK